MSLDGHTSTMRYFEPLAIARRCCGDSPAKVTPVRFAVTLVIFAAIWMIVRVSGLFKSGPDGLPAWTCALVALVVLTGPAVFTLAEDVHWMVRLLAAMLFLLSAFVFPWFYDRFPLFLWLTILLAYVEIFWLLPLVQKNRHSGGD